MSELLHECCFCHKRPVIGEKISIGTPFRVAIINCCDITIESKYTYHKDDKDRKERFQKEAFNKWQKLMARPDPSETEMEYKMALERIRDHDQHVMYNRCPDCDHESWCSENRAFKVMPYSKSGEIADEALKGEPK